MQKYLVLVKQNPAKTGEFYYPVSKINEKPAEGIKVLGSYNLFGPWDFAIWFEAETSEAAMHFVGDKIRPLEGIHETLTMPATPIKEYKM